MYKELQQKIEIFQNRKINLYQLLDLQNNCNNEIAPIWKDVLLVEKSVPDIIRRIWHPISIEAKSAIDFLVTRITNIVVISDIQSSYPIQLGYVFQVKSLRLHRTYLNAWIAGLPIDSEFSSVSQIEPEPSIPSIYKQFCSIHNGFTLNGNSSIGFVPMNQLRLFISPKDNKVMLEFCGNGLGNLQCFDFNSNTNDTYEWDHESVSINNKLGFWDFFNKFLSTSTG